METSREAVDLALVQSIDCWRRKQRATDVESVVVGAAGCPLCQIFLLRGSCVGCPVDAVTGCGCSNSPYPQAQSAWVKMRDDPSGLNVSKFRTCAEKEVEFLEKVLRWRTPAHEVV